MPRDINGVYTRVRRWTDDRTNGVPFQAERIDEDTDDIASAVSLTYSKAQVDSAIAAVDATSQITAYLATYGPVTVVETATPTPPATPTTGQKFLVIATATGTFAGHETAVATYTGSYTYVTPVLGRPLIAKDTSGFYVWDGTSGGR